MIEWTNELVLGIEVIDNQHKDIYTNINKLILAFEENNEQELAYEMLEFVEEYVRKHFQTEEFYLKKYGYNEFEKHVGLHRNFSAQLQELKASFKRAGITKRAALQMTEFLISWWDNHILKIDSKYVEWLSEKIANEN